MCSNLTPGSSIKYDCNHGATCSAVPYTPQTTAAAPYTPQNVVPPPVPSGKVYGFWKGYAGSCHMQTPTDTSYWYFAFPGIYPVPSRCHQVPADAKNFKQKILTIGGGPTTWGDKLYEQVRLEVQGSRSIYDEWDGICVDWEMTGADHTNNGFNAMTAAIKKAGKLMVLTTTAEGPWKIVTPTSGKPKGDFTTIDWSNIDYLVPQLYGGTGAMYVSPELGKYAEWWNNPTTPSIHGATFSKIDTNKILWGITPGAEKTVFNPVGGGFITWCADGAGCSN